MKKLLIDNSQIAEYQATSPRTVSISSNSLEFGLDSGICIEEEEERAYEVDEFRGSFSDEYTQLRRKIENMFLKLEDHGTGWSFKKVVRRKDLEKLSKELENLKEGKRD
ncbi:uncharacterized protein ELE39_000180 [Cryptosporidium sp. chipmunk genotype I]|uniref:uncharacterized protein n=1 Tax=Cryptosporidium sp. chipmunk genotype I TaxID=1280935 RepID=UPI00351AA6CB|nr:hypothetical protein ELE39_000180 [Cryptosporidium sp. chipmunk genotype I]